MPKSYPIALTATAKPPIRDVVQTETVKNAEVPAETLLTGSPIFGRFRWRPLMWTRCQADTCTVSGEIQ